MPGSWSVLLAALLGCEPEEACPPGGCAVDPCPLDAVDHDGDGVCDREDPCPRDAPDDTDGDGACDSADPCPEDAPDDADEDGVCERVDACLGDDASGDSDTDGVCDDEDVCLGDDAVGDSDTNGMCDDQEVVRVESGDRRSRFGWSVAGAGDVDGDGFADVMVGAPWTDGTVRDVGQALLFRGSAAGLVVEPAWVAHGREELGDTFGVAVASTGDVNGDGFDDVAVGAANDDVESGHRDRVEVFLGSAGGLEPIVGWSAVGPEGDVSFGRAVASAGDVNADGFADLVVGAPLREFETGAAFLYLGSAAGLEAAPAWSRGQDDPRHSRVGGSVSSAGDVDGDGCSDVLVGAAAMERNMGSAFLYLGATSGLEAEPAWVGSGERVQDSFGRSVASAGDVDGDGYADFVIGAPGAPSSYSTGAAYAWFGAADLDPAASAGWSTLAPLGQLDVESFGSPVSSAGDVDDDGFDDVLVGMSEHRDLEVTGGAVFLYSGSPFGLTTLPTWMAASDQDGARFGASAQGAGDVDHDGRDDLVVGAPEWDGIDVDRGAMFLFPSSPE